MSTAPDVFLSYNREDQAMARRFAEGFEREGLNVWWDVTLRSGEAYDKVTEQALRSAKAVVVLWSKKSVDSRWVRAEATLADRQRTLVPAMIEPCERPIMFELTQTADLCHWDGDGADPGWKSFLADVQQFVRERGSRGVAPAGASAPAPVAPSTGSSDHRPSLAVLPFANRSRDADDDVFADGMVEDLIAALSLNPSMKVIARSATLAYRGNTSDLRSIGRNLGVRYLMEGNVRRVGSALRVTTQLIEADAGTILWTQKFDRPLTELAELQESLVTEVANALGVQVHSAEIRRTLQKPDDLNAWEAVTRAQALGMNMAPESAEAAIAEARRAIAIDPRYAPGHATLAGSLSVYNNLMKPGGPSPSLRLEALEHVDRALALDSSDPYVLSLAAIVQMGSGAHMEGAACARRALAINPNAASGRHAILFACLRDGLADEAVTHAQAYLTLAPGDFRNHLILSFLALAHFMAGRYAQALDAIDRALEFRPTFAIAVRDRAVYLDKLGRRDEGRAAVRRLRSIAPADSLDVHLTRIEASGALGPEAARSLGACFRDIWLDTPQEPSQA
jgi:TolB-like protein